MNKVKYYDIGLNLFCRQYKFPEQIISDAEKDGIVCFLTGTNTKENIRIDKFVKNHNVFGTAGIHPHNANSAKKDDFERIEQIVKGNPKIVAVGECGLDFDRMFSTKENQISCLEMQIEIAERHNKPLFLHERAAFREFTEQFKNHREICSRSVVHCFTGNVKELECYLEMGFNIGITGWICDDGRASELRKAVRLIPLDRLLIETDAPYLTPKNVWGLDRINVPQNIKYVVKDLSKYMGVSENEIIKCTKENTERLFLHNFSLLSDKFPCKL